MIGFRILPRSRKVDADTVSKFSALPVANISDSMSRMTAGGAALRPMHAGGVLAGPAFTVKTRPGDNLMLHKAIDIAESGDVIVVDGGGDLTNSLIGEMMSAHAEHRGIAGMVIYGSIRDYDSIHAGRFPIFAAGVTHRGPYKDGPGEINVPIAIDGMVIEPGDLIVGDGATPTDGTTLAVRIASYRADTGEELASSWESGELQPVQFVEPLVVRHVLRIRGDSREIIGLESVFQQGEKIFLQHFHPGLVYRNNHDGNDVFDQADFFNCSPVRVHLCRPRVPLGKTGRSFEQHFEQRELVFRR